MTRARVIVIGGFLLPAGLAAVSGCSHSGEREVLAIERTKTYHRSTCPPVHMAKTVLMTVSQADTLHLVPCPVCAPNRR